MLKHIKIAFNILQIFSFKYFMRESKTKQLLFTGTHKHKNKSTL